MFFISVFKHLFSHLIRHVHCGEKVSVFTKFSHVRATFPCNGKFFRFVFRRISQVYEGFLREVFTTFASSFVISRLPWTRKKRGLPSQDNRMSSHFRHTVLSSHVRASSKQWWRSPQRMQMWWMNEWMLWCLMSLFGKFVTPRQVPGHFTRNDPHREKANVVRFVCIYS